MLGQILKVIRLLGLGRAAKMKKHHDAGLSYIRGYAVCQCWWSLLRCGFLDELVDRKVVDFETFAAGRNLNRASLAAIIDYLHGAGLLERDGRVIRLSEAGRVLLDEPRGFFELAMAYEPCFTNLDDTLRGAKRYGRDFTRDVTLVGVGSGRLCEQLPYQVMRKMVLGHGCKMVLDLGCGDLAFLAGLCKMSDAIRCHGLDVSVEMVQFNEQLLAKNNFAGRLTTQQGDMFDIPPLPKSLPPVDCITACDSFHEYLGADPNNEKIIALLRSLKQQFPRAIFVVGEFCLQNETWLRKHKTASLEHHLFHELSNQQIGSAETWRRIFESAGLEIIEENIFDLIGHGYFALR